MKIQFGEVVGQQSFQMVIFQRGGNSRRRTFRTSKIPRCEFFTRRNGDFLHGRKYQFSPGTWKIFARVSILADRNSVAKFPAVKLPRADFLAAKLPRISNFDPISAKYNLLSPFSLRFLILYTFVLLCLCDVFALCDMFGKIAELWLSSKGFPSCNVFNVVWWNMRCCVC